MITPMQRLHQEVTRFNLEVLGLPVPEHPTMLSANRTTWAEHALKEEVQEFLEATTPEDQADALLDLVYFALGRVLELGFPPGVLFDEIQLANMAKKKGELSKRPGALGFDAIKPGGWTPPELTQYLSLTRADIKATIEGKKPFTPKAMVEANTKEMEDFSPPAGRYDIVHSRKIVVIGHARHGKDTVAEMLRDSFGLKYVPSSLVCAEKVILPAMLDKSILREVVNGSSCQGASLEELGANLLELHRWSQTELLNPNAVFKERGNHRLAWHEIIKWYNKGRSTKLAELVFESSDIYAGVRATKELNGIKNAGLADIIIWVDASERLPLEDASSMAVKPWMADYILDNNGTEKELRANLQALVDAHF